MKCFQLVRIPSVITLALASLREAYDRYGEETLKNGYLSKYQSRIYIRCSDREGQIQGYCFNGDPFEIFEIFFGTANPFAIALDEQGKQVKMIEKIESDLHKDAVTDRKDTHAADLEIKTSCTLKEFFMGCTKRLNFSKTVTLGDGKTTENVVTSKEIEIKPGMKPGTTYRFTGEGNKFPDKLVGDLIVVIGQHEHDSIKRVGDDLIYRHKVTLSNALTAAEVEFRTLEGELIKYRPDEIITPEF